MTLAKLTDITPPPEKTVATMTAHPGSDDDPYKTSTSSYDETYGTLGTFGLGASAFVGNLKLEIPITDKSAEIARLQKEIAKVEKYLDKSTQLMTEGFIKNAPSARVLQEQTRFTELQALRDKLSGCLSEIQAEPPSNDVS